MGIILRLCAGLTFPCAGDGQLAAGTGIVLTALPHGNSLKGFGQPFAVQIQRDLLALTDKCPSKQIICQQCHGAVAFEVVVEKIPQRLVVIFITALCVVGGGTVFFHLYDHLRLANATGGHAARFDHFWMRTCRATDIAFAVCEALVVLADKAAGTDIFAASAIQLHVMRRMRHNDHILGQ